jgi:hypothetical protein
MQTPLNEDSPKSTVTQEKKMDVATSDFEIREKGNAQITRKYFLQDNYFGLHKL